MPSTAGLGRTLGECIARRRLIAIPPSLLGTLGFIDWFDATYPDH